MIPVSAATASRTRAVKRPGSVTKLSPEIWKRASMPIPKSAAARSASSSIHVRQAGAAVGVVEADVDGRRRLRRDDVRGRVADVDRGDRQRRGPEVRGARVEGPRREPVEQAHEPRQRVPRAVGIGGMALLAIGLQVGGERPAPPDLHRVAHALGAGGLADEAMVHALAVRRHPVEDRGRAVDPVALLVAGDGDDEAAGGRRRARRSRWRPPPRRRPPTSCRPRPGPTAGPRRSRRRRGRGARTPGCRPAPRRRGR